jgi:hypothetical protein
VTAKYGNVRTNGYASKREAELGAKLAILFRAGKIEDLKEQVHIILIPGKGKLKGITYVADFTYNDLDGTPHVLDAKGCRTPVYKLKRKMLKLLHDIDIEEI